MKRISITGANRYDRIDEENWILVPRYSDVKRTSFLDVMDLALYRDDPSEKPEVSMEEVYKVVSEL